MDGNKNDELNDETNDTVENEREIKESSINYLSSLKIPPFWSNRPDLWFLQVETQFRIKGITSSNTKFDHLVASLPNDTMELVSDILLTPPTTNKYETLKQQLLTRSIATEERRLDTLLHKIQIGDTKPSELYRQMEALAGNNSLINPSLLKNLWLKKLPSNLQTCLIAIESNHTNEELFTIADKIFDSNSNPNISTVQQNTNTQCSVVSSDTADPLKNIEKRLRRLEIKQFRSRSSSRRPSRERYPRRNRSSRSRSKSKLCYYHRRFGNNAKKCTTPCKKSNLVKNSNKEQKNEN